MISFKTFLTETFADINTHANEYVKKANLPNINASMQTSSEEKGKPIADAFSKAAEGSDEYKKKTFDGYQKHQHDMVKTSGAHDYDSLKKASYEAMEKETSSQYDHLVSKGYKFSFHGGDHDYKDSNAMRDDLHNNKHLHVFNGGDQHEFLNKTDNDGVNSNHKFRAVHDAFGHGMLKNGFGPKGEETAWHIHSQMYSPLARPAMTAETRGQNSWVNYSGINKGKSPKDTTYAPQKAVLLPHEMNS
jgi:hypothetical protein